LAAEDLLEGRNWRKLMKLLSVEEGEKEEEEEVGRRRKRRRIRCRTGSRATEGEKRARMSSGWM